MLNMYDSIKIVDKLCVANCPPKTYKDTQYQACMKCNNACKTCYGPTNKECLECDSENGYTKVRDECKLITCQDGTYMSNTAKCLPCHSSCSVCKGPNVTDCIIYNKNTVMSHDSE